MRKTTIFIGIIILIILILGSYFAFFRKEKNGLSLARVSRADVIQEVSETGTVKQGDEIDLSFKTSGRIKNVYVQVGDKVETGKTLANLDTAQLSVQLKEAQASLAVAQAQFNKILAGASAEEIKTAETAVQNKQIALQTAQENLNQAYEDALNVLQDSYLKLYNSLIAVTLIQRTYFYSTDQEGVIVQSNKTKMENAAASAKAGLDTATDNPADENIDAALSEMEKSLNAAFSALGAIRENCETPNYQNKVSSADKTILDTQRTNVNTVLTATTNAKQNISSMKLSEAAAQGALQTVQDELSELKAPPRQADLDLYESQVREARAQVDVINIQIGDSAIVSPTAGQITAIEKRAGETVSIAQTVISFLPSNPFQLEVDIYEEDIVKVKVGDAVLIEFTALSGETFAGKVISINPTEKLIDGVVYYEVTIDFDDSPPPEIKPGMTADITIKTDFRQNVLAVPKSAIEKRDGNFFVQVSEGNEVKERQIQIGLEGSNDLTEVISGLNEGEEVVLK